MSSLPWQKSSRSLHSNRLHGFVFSIDLHFLFESFVERQVSLANQTLSMSVAAPIVYRIRVLKVIGAAEQKGSGL